MPPQMDERKSAGRHTKPPSLLKAEAKRADDKATLASVKKEMAQSRMAPSVRLAETHQRARLVKRKRSATSSPWPRSPQPALA